MSTHQRPSLDLTEPPGNGAPELTELGKRIEVFRIQRGLSKQHLARFAGASRQQLWRVLTGKSELTESLAVRLADALSVPIDTLRLAPPVAHLSTAETLPPLAVQLTDPRELEAIFALLPGGPDGVRLKRALLDVAEELCLAANRPVAGDLVAMRARVLADAVA